MVKLATAALDWLAQLRYDDGQYYARFVVKNVDNSDSYLRQPHRGNGTLLWQHYVEGDRLYVLMMKIDEQNMEGGNSLLLRNDDWEHLESFCPSAGASRHALGGAAKQNVSRDVTTVFDVNNKAARSCVISTNSSAKDFEGVWLSELSDALETSQNISVPVPVGKFLLINNLFWLATDAIVFYAAS
ncbi:carbon starvation induced protein CsiD [Salmonella enterica subsp. enterica]|nr:carbon starvation induced protein CsiD [Salmonella enterica subsp. enterica]